MKFIPSPRCKGLTEIPAAISARAKVNGFLSECLDDISPHEIRFDSPELRYVSRGLAYTVGSAVDETPPSDEECFQAFLVPNSGGLSAGARAWTKHAHRSGLSEGGVASNASWWGRPKGPVSTINEKASEIFWKIMRDATWKNLHWLPHEVLVFEVRVEEGYGMRWSQDCSNHPSTGILEETLTQCGPATLLANLEDVSDVRRPWTFRGFVEPMMEDGHERGWRH